MKYFFILGNNPTLSLAELAAIFNYGQFSLIQNNIAILETTHEIDAKIIKKIGGVIKFGPVYNELASLAIHDILKSTAAFAKPEIIESKFYFGISFYGKVKINIKAIGMEFKKLLKLSGINSRWVISQEPTLSSVVVEQNKLVTAKGVEIVMIEFNKKLLLGKTLAVQPFKELSFRDYGRPARDDRSGMLPPKLAQIMINLAVSAPLTKGDKGGFNVLRLTRGEIKEGVLDETNQIILDPFCGSGTIITEAMLMGYKNIIGADISDRAIRDTKINIEWIKKSYELRVASCELYNSDATQISKHLAPNSIDAIVTEPYLGPQRGRFDIKKTVSKLERLYAKSLLELKKILKPAGKIVMVWPVFQTKPNSIFLNPDLGGLKIINPIPENLQTNIFIKLTNRQTIIYGREQQKVWREIVVLEK